MAILAIFHIIFIVLLIGLVLIQDSKSGALGAFGGGGASNSVFGASGGGNFLVRATTFVAILFAITCLTLTYKTSGKNSSVIDALLPSAIQSEPLKTPQDATNKDSEKKTQ